MNLQLQEACSEKEALSSDNETLRLRVDELNGGSVELESLRKQIKSLRNVRESTQDALYKFDFLPLLPVFCFLEFLSAYSI